MFSFSSPPTSEESTYRLVSAIFLRLLAIIYFIAFYSMTSQVVGLVGSDGILPVTPWLQQLLIELDWQAFVFFPSLLWFESSDLFLRIVAWSGCVFALGLLLNFLPRLNLILLFVFYLTLVTGGQTFMNFQWDGLLLEAGFLAIFLRPDSRVLIFLFRWLLFRLRFMSGISKLVMGDPSWLGMTALIYYFETQPLPHVGAWYFHNLPQNVLIAATVLVLIVEIIVPFMMFLPRRYRLVAAWVTLVFQLLIVLSSNHNWFNLLTIALILFLFDDQALSRILPRGLIDWLQNGWKPRLRSSLSSSARGFHGLLAGVLIGAGVLSIYRMAVNDRLAEPVNVGLDVLQAWHIVNGYHVFPTMTTRQIELKVEGSWDGMTWYAYRFRYRPDDPAVPPGVVLPHHPRLDWMMWFVPFSPRFLHWFDSFLIALMDNSQDVTALLQDNPFAKKAPNYLRVHAWRYEFTTYDEKANTGHWWKRQYLGLFPPLPGKQRMNQAG